MGVTLCQNVKKLYKLYIYIYIFVQFLKFFTLSYDIKYSYLIQKISKYIFDP